MSKSPAPPHVPQGDPQRHRGGGGEGEIDPKPGQRKAAKGDADAGQQWNQRAHDESALDDPDVPGRIPDGARKQDGQHDMGERQPVVGI